MQLLCNFARFRVSRSFCLPATAALLLITLTFITAIVEAVPAWAAAGQSVRFFPATSHSVGGAFLKFYDTHGGVNIIGYPLSEEVAENGRTVQYFERQRMEYHPQYAGTTNEVQMSLLGVQRAYGKPAAARIAPFTSTADRVYIPATGHSISNTFLGYWKANGDVRVFGYPLTEPANENGYLVQYFERARMEYHPEKPGLNYGIELGHLGKEYMLAAGLSGLLQAKTLSVSTAPQSAGPVANSIGPASELLSLLNAARQQAGLARVAPDGQISVVSQARSQDMAGRNYFSHTTPEGTDFMDALKAAGVPFKLTGEILAMNNFSADKTVRTAYDTFMNSPAHRAIALDGRYNTAGVGVASDGKGYYYYAVIFTQR